MYTPSLLLTKKMGYLINRTNPLFFRSKLQTNLSSPYRHLSLAFSNQPNMDAYYVQSTLSFSYKMISQGICFNS